MKKETLAERQYRDNDQMTLSFVKENLEKMIAKKPKGIAIVSLNEDGSSENIYWTDDKCPLAPKALCGAIKGIEDTIVSPDDYVEN